MKILKIGIQILLVLIIAFVLFFFWASSPNLEESEYAKLITPENAIAPENDSIFSIVTYNIGYLSGMTNNLSVETPKELFDSNLNKVLQETQTTSPDIIAFQEIDYNSSRSYHINQQNEIAKLGYNYIAKAINWDETYVPFPYWPPSVHFGKIISGQSIVSKYPLKNHERIVLERVATAPFYEDALYLERLAQVATVTLNNKDVILINVHLEAFDKPTRVRQFETVLKIFNSYKNKYPTILLGDFNSLATDTEGIIQKMFSLENVGNAAFNAKNPLKTYPSDKPKERIDYIFYTKNTIEYINGNVLNQFGKASDHLPVAMSFRLK